MRHATKLTAVLSVVCLAAAPGSACAQYTVLHFCYGGDSDGEYPVASLIQSGSTLYGMTSAGGSGDFGTVFKIGVDGTGFSLLHSFGFNAANPFGSLIQSGSTLYGMTSIGGSGGLGTIFQIGADGTGFNLLHSFSQDDGVFPYGSLIQSGSTLYGMTSVGGSGGNGTVFRVGTDGTDFSVLHSFADGPSDGARPYGSLIQSGSTLYGMTTLGGSGGGTIFKVGTDGTGFNLLHSFAGGASDGTEPYGSLIQSGSTLYGMTTFGGSDDSGTVFKVGTDGAGFSLLHSFTGASDHSITWPNGSLIQSGSTIYGMTGAGGSSGNGTIFQIESDGTGYNLLHSFAGGDFDGAHPFVGSLIQSGSTLYGMTLGGSSNNSGTIFSLVVPEPSSLVLALSLLCITLFRGRILK